MLALLLTLLLIPGGGGTGAAERLAPFKPRPGDPETPAAVVRIGVLLPMFRSSRVPKPLLLDADGTVVLAAFEQALVEINDHTDGLWGNVLPRTDLQFSFGDSRRDAGITMRESYRLAQTAFGGEGVDVVYGVLWANLVRASQGVLRSFEIPQVGVAAGADFLSSVEDYPYFTRVYPTASPAVTAMCDIVTNILGFSRVSVLMQDLSVAGGGNWEFDAFQASAANVGIEFCTVQTISVNPANIEVDYEGPVKSTVDAGCRTVVLLVDAAVAGKFMGELGKVHGWGPNTGVVYIAGEGILNNHADLREGMGMDQPEHDAQFAEAMRVGMGMDLPEHAAQFAEAMRGMFIAAAADFNGVVPEYLPWKQRFDARPFTWCPSPGATAPKTTTRISFTRATTTSTRARRSGALGARA